MALGQTTPIPDSARELALIDLGGTQVSLMILWSKGYK
jgi:hypothetical protein